MTEKFKAYPTSQLDHDPDLLHVCWSMWQAQKNIHDAYSGITHIVRDGGKRTLCGIYIAGNPTWDYEIWGRKDHGFGRQPLGVDDIGCIRCKRSSRIVTISCGE